MKTKLVIGLAVAVGCAIAGMMIVRRQAAPQIVKAEHPVVDQERPAAVTVEAPATPDRPVPEQLAPPQTQPVKPAAQTNVRQQPAAPQTYQDALPTDPAEKEKLGRLALSYVGADPAADAVWVWLINDPDLSGRVREDLIEDLNENGFSDGNGTRATVDDLPLIESRIALLEEHAPFAMDEVNSASFQEVYKDLVNMYNRLTRR